MQVILLEKIKHLGALGSQVKVKPGYARNYLIPQKKAVPANAGNVAKFEAKRAEFEKMAADVLSAAEKRAAALEGMVVEIAAKAGDEGKLFGSIGTRDILDAIKQKGVEILKSEISLPDGVIRQTGEYEIFIQLHTDLRVPVKVNVVPE